MTTRQSSGDAVNSEIATATVSEEMSVTSTSGLFLHHRLKIVEDLWEIVLKQECGQNLVDLLNQLRHLCSPEGQAATAIES